MLGVNTGASGNKRDRQLQHDRRLDQRVSGALMLGRYDAASNYTTDTYTQSGGTASVGQFTIGGAAGGSANLSLTFTVTGGTFSATSFPGLSAGDANTAAITIAGWPR